ncbi:hypothetical protein SS1G_13972 [Sclerotinia sclerotiorum 1980 UF-70]|uniref:Uncharacterized protein n=1 Tax=Sclerotinia sclerotiorum (strain ATCC 18683 / 1980 / Ss-1) TaxID=665079 RepID=A7F8P1_SCLS1|nr:hypothetical protein SS1G_13972 [Sclerotinia sclerotiorum 1980 UF-70]EDN99112.1 hypothetical protein SS1G_13972 [Sclerotinia sclerotiorum 1980 UF-70]
MRERVVVRRRRRRVERGVMGRFGWGFDGVVGLGSGLGLVDEDGGAGDGEDEDVDRSQEIANYWVSYKSAKLSVERGSEEFGWMEKIVDGR